MLAQCRVAKMLSSGCLWFLPFHDMSQRNKKRVVWFFAIGIVVFLLLGWLGPLVPYKKSAIWICPVTCSTRIDTAWFGLYETEERHVSSLEEWLRAREPDFQPEWKHLATNTYYSFGARLYACSQAPEVYLLKPLMAPMVDHADDKRLGDWVVVLRVGSRQEQKRFVRQMAHEFFENL